VTSPRRRCVVIGGGLAGLAAAYALASDPAYDVLVLESTHRPGGKLQLAELAGINVDVGAESMLNRRPEGVALVRELGLPLVHPTAARPRLWSRGAMRPLPRSLMGVPLDVDDLARSEVLSAAGLETVRRERDLSRTHLPDDADISVGALVAQRMGEEVVDRLVEPLLGGVYAGRAHEISACAAVPGLVEQARRGSWLAQASPATGTEGAPSDPVFAGIEFGVGRLPSALVAAGRFTVRTDAVVRAIRRAPSGFLLEVALPGGNEAVEADDLIVATPAAVSARLLRHVAPGAADQLALIESASVAVVSLAVPAAGTAHLETSGFLVPPLERTGVKAATFSWAKWAWVRDAGRSAEAGADLALLRASWGRHREEWVLQRTDEELVALTVQDLARTCGFPGPVVDAHVQRWGGGLPQYAVGHLDRVARIRGAVAGINGAVPGAGRIAVCGAAYDGVGIPAVIASAHAAAAQIAR
jgi:oxygen-dependent protoporphyrinogen oxidase